MTTATTTPGRWGIRHPSYPWVQCRFCGRSASSEKAPDCPPTTCTACDSRQCLYPHECAVCLVGYLNDVGYAPGGGRPRCGYARCDNLAVARAPRVRHVCREHLDRPSRVWGGKRHTLAEDIAHRVAVRDGVVRERFSHRQLVWMPEASHRRRLVIRHP